MKGEGREEMEWGKDSVRDFENRRVCGGGVVGDKVGVGEGVVPTLG